MNGSPVPAPRVEPLTRLLEALHQAGRLALTTHVNADGDGTGSQAALAAWLQGLGKRVHVVNPTPFPALYRHLLEDESIIRDAAHPETQQVLKEADTLVVVDTAEPRRIGRVASALRGPRVLVLDHHVEIGRAHV